MQLIATALSVFLTGAVLLGCNTSPSDSGKPLNLSYRVEGVFVKDFNLHNCRAQAEFWRNDSSIADAAVIFGGHDLTFGEDSYELEITPEGSIPAGAYVLSVKDSLYFAETFASAVTGLFEIEISDPASRVNNGGGQVSVDWSGSVDADGYILATVPRYLAYAGEGHSQWVTSQVTAGTIPPDAFRMQDGLNPDTGWYFVYVYAYDGVPDSVLSAELLPVPLPNQLDDNIAEKDITGHFGTVTVVVRDSVWVTTQQ